MPAVPRAGVPLRTPLLLRVTPVGKVPVWLNVAAGNPVAVTVKLPAIASVKVVLLTLVMAGGWLTVRVKLWLSSEPTPLPAVTVKLNVYGPAPRLGGVPVMMPLVLLMD